VVLPWSSLGLLCVALCFLSFFAVLKMYTISALLVLSCCCVLKYLQKIQNKLGRLLIALIGPCQLTSVHWAWLCVCVCARL